MISDRIKIEQYSKQDIALLDAHEDETFPGNIDQKLQKLQDDLHVKQHEIFFETYEVGKTYSMKLKPFFVVVSKKNEEGLITMFEFMTSEHQKVIMNSGFIRKLETSQLLKILLQKSWIPVEVIVKQVSDNGYEIQPTDLEFTLTYDTDDLKRLMNDHQ